MDIHPQIRPSQRRTKAPAHGKLLVLLVVMSLVAPKEKAATDQGRFGMVRQ